MPTCDDVRTMIAIGDTEDALCSNTYPIVPSAPITLQKSQAFDQFVAGKSSVAPPPQLTAKLLAIATDHAIPARARAWWATPAVVVIGMIAVAFSVFLSAQMTLWFAEYCSISRLCLSDRHCSRSFVCVGRQFADRSGWRLQR
jgi:hypothetical protein